MPPLRSRGSRCAHGGAAALTGAGGGGGAGRPLFCWVPPSAKVFLSKLRWPGEARGGPGGGRGRAGRAEGDPYIGHGPPLAPARARNRREARGRTGEQEEEMVTLAIARAVCDWGGAGRACGQEDGKRKRERNWLPAPRKVRPCPRPGCLLLLSEGFPSPGWPNKLCLFEESGVETHLPLIGGGGQGWPWLREASLMVVSDAPTTCDCIERPRETFVWGHKTKQKRRP